MEENRIQMKNDRKLWYGLIILGSFALLNAFISSFLRPKGLLHDNQVITIHWINTVILLAGLAPFVFNQKSLKSETAIVVTNIISLCVSVSCAISDFWNVGVKMFGNPNSTSFFAQFLSEDVADIRDHLFTYNCLDLMICILAACCSHQLISNRIRISPASHMTDSRKLQGFGLALIIVATLGLFNYSWQRFVMAHHKLAIFLDMHTIDEFCWLNINIATGVLVFLASRGNQIVQGCAFVLSGATIYPSFFYAWLDYRIVTSTHSKFLFKYSMFSLAITIPHIAVLLAIFLMFTVSLRDIGHVRLEKMHKIIFGAFSMFFLTITVSLVDVTFYAAFTKQFYRIFHSSEQKLPFLVAFLSLFTGLSVISKMNFLTIAASLIIGILTVNATYLHIFSYSYLRFNGYFMDGDSLDFPMLPSDKYANGTESSMVHTVESSLNLLSLVGAFSLVSFLMYLCRTHTVQPEMIDETNQIESKFKHESRVLRIGVMMLFASLTLLFLAFYIFLTASKIHPLVTIYSQIFQIVLGLSITSFALFQVLVAEKLSKYPLFMCSLLMISIIRSLDILTQIDYKDADGQPLSWTIHAVVEYFMIFAHFLTIGSVLHAQGPGRALIEPAEIPMSFENPLGNGTDGNGYIMLRTNENQPSEIQPQEA